MFTPGYEEQYDKLEAVPAGVDVPCNWIKAFPSFKLLQLTLL